MHPLRRAAPELRHPVLLACLLSLTFVWTPATPGLMAQEARINPAGRAVLITGATSGIGRLTTELLARRGFFVYAGARSADDMASLNALAGVQAIRLDVTVPEQIEAAVATVRAGGRGLYALINNAGVATLGPVVEIRDQDLHSTCALIFGGRSGDPGVCGADRGEPRPDSHDYLDRGVGALRVHQPLCAQQVRRGGFRRSIGRGDDPFGSGGGGHRARRL